MKDYFDTLLQYHNWANKRLFEVLDSIPPQEYGLNLGNSFGGIRGTAVHTYGAELIWVSRLHGDSPSAMPSETEFSSWPELREIWQEILTKIDAFRKELGADFVYQPIDYKNTSGQSFTQPVWEIVTHFVNHASYHRGQIVTMARQLEQKAGREPMAIQSMDMVAFYRQ